MVVVLVEEAKGGFCVIPSFGGIIQSTRSLTHIVYTACQNNRSEVVRVNIFTEAKALLTFNFFYYFSDKIVFILNNLAMDLLNVRKFVKICFVLQIKKKKTKERKLTSFLVFVL